MPLTFSQAPYTAMDGILGDEVWVMPGFFPVCEVLQVKFEADVGLSSGPSLFTI